MTHHQSVAPYFERLLDHLPLMVFVKHAADLRFAFVNKAAEQIIGHPRSALLGKTDFDFFPQAQADHFTTNDREALQSGKLNVVVEPIATASGPRWLRTGKVALTDETGAPVFVLGISEDITEARAADEERKQLHWLLDSVVEHVPMMVFVKHADDLRFALWNRAGAELIGHAREDLLGKTDHDFFPQAQADFFTARDREVLDSGALVAVEEPIETAHGPRQLFTKKIPIFDDDGAPRFLLGVSEDITERKAREAALAAKSRALEETLAQLIALEPLAVTGQQARSYAADMLRTAQRSDNKGLEALVRAFAKVTGATDPPPAASTVDLNEVVTTVGHHHPSTTTVQLASAPLSCRGSRADAVQLADALAVYLQERSTGPKITLQALLDDGLPRIRLSAEGQLPALERARLLRPGAQLEGVSATARARLAVARSAALHSGAQLFSRTDQGRVILDIIFEPVAEQAPS
jgi:PAS domain S-box-containing protein